MKADVDVAHFGTLFHKSAELAYDRLTERGNMVHDFEIEALIKDDKTIEHFVDEAFRQDFFHTPEGTPLPYNGTQLIVRHVIKKYLIMLLQLDKRRTPFQYIDSERPVYHPITIENHGTQLPIMLGGTVDRIDSKEGITRIIDYKTGGKQKTVKNIEELFYSDKRDGYVLQAFYYSHLLQKDFAQIAPSLLFVRKTSDDNFEPNIIINGTPVTDYSIYSEEFATLLTRTIDEIFNSDVPYAPTNNKEVCKYCKLTSLCRCKANEYEA